MRRAIRHARSIIWLTALPVAALAIAAAVAQPPDAPPGNRPHGPADRLRAALDANGDHELDEEELANATAALRSLDEDGNGRIDRNEFRPPMPPPPREFGDRGPDRRPEGRPPREAAGPRPREPGDRPSPERFVERAMSFDADADGKLDREELGKFAEAMMARMRAGIADRGLGDRRPRREPPDSE
jgi:hypothetical protein